MDHPYEINGDCMRRILTLTLAVGCLLFEFLPAFWRPVSQARAGDGTPSGSEDPQVWADPLTGLEFVYLPGGCFLMGSAPDEEDRSADEGPVHRVCVEGLWMGKHEVTVGQFRTFVEATGYRTVAEREGFSWGYDGEWMKKPGNNWRNAGFEQSDVHPVVNVSWDDAQAMAQWMTGRGPGRFRLPSEAEWEYGCRAGVQSARFWGGDKEEACRYANVADQTAREHFPAWTVHPCSDGYVFTAPCGSFPANGLGLCDMLGNVAEWAADGYREDAYARHSEKSPGVDPTDSSRVVRGGSWFSQPKGARCAARDHLMTPTRRSNDLGFRLVRFP